MAAGSNAEQIEAERALAILAAQASGQRGMAESSSEIDRRAQELVLFELVGKPAGHVHTARYILSPTAEAVQIAVHERAAELYAELIAAAPGIWNGRDQLIADAKNAMKGDSQ